MGSPPAAGPPNARDLIDLALPQSVPVRLTRMLIGRLCLNHLAGAYELLLLRPALVHALEAPLNAAPRRPDRPVADEDEDRIRVRGAQDPQRHPAAARNLHAERDVPQLPVGHQLLGRHWIAVHDDLHGHLVGDAYPRALDAPERPVGARSVVARTGQRGEAPQARVRRLAEERGSPDRQSDP